jgi:hypothetical protein
MKKKSTLVYPYIPSAIRPVPQAMDFLFMNLQTI